jgi:hypothetical protein
MSVEAVLAGLYAAMLLAIAAGLDRLARHSHNRSARYRTAGFAYRRDLDLWECPEGEHLNRHETDHDRRVVRYRARADVCNQCPAKAGCTDSDRGRELVSAMDPWPHSEAGRFHRGVCALLAFLAGLIAAIALVRGDGPADFIVLAALLGVATMFAARLLGSFRRTPTGFPA